uniref:Uncharacterized protein n=1 Tax=Chrysotila carterae TaxID=13221 RepID=A0A7S4EVP4_CHRCT
MKAGAALRQWEAALEDYAKARMELRSAEGFLEDWAETFGVAGEDVCMEQRDLEVGLALSDLEVWKARVSTASEEVVAGVAACKARVEAFRARVQAASDTLEPPMEGDAVVEGELNARWPGSNAAVGFETSREEKEALAAAREAAAARRRAEALQNIVEEASSDAEAAMISRKVEERKLEDKRSAGEMAVFGAAQADSFSKEEEEEPVAVADDEAAIEEAARDALLVDEEFGSAVKDELMQAASAVNDAEIATATDKTANTVVAEAAMKVEHATAVETNEPPPKRMRASMHNSPAPMYDLHDASGGRNSDHESDTQVADSTPLPRKQRAHAVTRQDDFSETSRNLLPDVESHAQLTSAMALQWTPTPPSTALTAGSAAAPCLSEWLESICSEGSLETFIPKLRKQFRTLGGMDKLLAKDAHVVLLYRMLADEGAGWIELDELREAFRSRYAGRTIPEVPEDVLKVAWGL